MNVCDVQNREERLSPTSSHPLLLLSLSHTTAVSGGSRASCGEQLCEVTEAAER